jgi:hypothetical protein
LKDEGTQSVTFGRLLKGVGKLMGIHMNWEGECIEEEELVVGELDRRMVAEEWSMGREDVVKQRRVPGENPQHWHEFLTIAWLRYIANRNDYPH